MAVNYHSEWKSTMLINFYHFRGFIWRLEPVLACFVESRKELIVLVINLKTKKRKIYDFESY